MAEPERTNDPGRTIPTIPIAHPRVEVMERQIPVGGQGPKKQDWSPPKTITVPYCRILGAELLSSEEKDRVAAIEAKAERKQASPEDLVWLASLVRRLSQIKADDYAFPEYAALVNPIAKAAYAMRYRRREPIDASLEIHPREWEARHVLLDVTTDSPVSDAILAVRAFVRVAPDTSPETLQELRKCRLHLTIDGEAVIQYESLEGYLVGPDGLGVRRIPDVLRLPDRSSLFYGAGFNGDNEADASLYQGLMLPNGSRILMRLEPGSAEIDEGVRLTAGLVAAHYTTRPER